MISLPHSANHNVGTVKIHRPVKLIAGCIFRDERVLDKARRLLESKFGSIDFESPAIPFTHTGYYEREFGKGLKRKFVSFKKLISPSRLAGIKAISNSIERRLSTGPNRLINIDPGYLDYAKLILASTKDYNHRVYVGKGIFAEITLSYQGNSFKPWDWTYPDYKSQEYIDIFNAIRRIYAGQVDAGSKS